MTLSERIRGLRRGAALVVLGRLAAGVFMLSLYSLWARGAATLSIPTLVAIAIWWVFTFVAALMALYRPGHDLTEILIPAAIFDGIVFGLLTSAYHEYEDPFYAWYLASAALSAVLIRRKAGWVLTGILSISYLVAHGLHAGAHTPMEYMLLVVNLAILIIVGTTISMVLGIEEDRKHRLEQQAEEVRGLNSALSRSVSELEAVTRITELIHSTLDVDTIGPLLLDILQGAIDIPEACLFAVDKSKGETVFSASTGAAGGAVRAARPAYDVVGHRMLTASDEGLACTEITDHHEIMVVLCATPESIDGLTENDRVVLQAVASELVVAVENSRLYKLTKRLAITDELSDLYNYRFLQQRIDEEIVRARRFEKPVSLLMIDVDDFKRVNDVYGHRVGDSVLSGVAHVLRTSVREVDVVARYGGEEFSVLLPETDASGAFIVAEKIREAVAIQRFADAEGERRIHVTTSIGLASYPVHAHDKESLLRAADDAVYRAKEGGKDRVRAPRLRMSRIPAEEEAAE